jgi:hypothetical protein
MSQQSSLTNPIMDEILDKINRAGIYSLSVDEATILQQNSTGQIDSNLLNWLNSDDEDTFDIDGKKLLYAEFLDDEDIFYNQNKLIRVISNTIGEPNKYNGSADWAGANVWTILGDKFYGTFIYLNEDDLCLLTRFFNEVDEENVDTVIKSATDPKELYQLLMHTLALKK